MFAPKGPINNIPALIKIMARRRPGNKLLSEPMIVSLPTSLRPKEFKLFFSTCAPHIAVGIYEYTSYIAFIEMMDEQCRKTSNIRRTSVGNKNVDHSDVVGASPVGVAPTIS